MQHVELTEILSAGGIRALDPALVKKHRSAKLAAAPRPCLHQLTGQLAIRLRAIENKIRIRLGLRQQRRVTTFSEARWIRRDASLEKEHPLYDGERISTYREVRRLWGHLGLQATDIIDRARRVIPHGTIVVDELIQDQVVIDPIVSIRDELTGEEAALLICEDHSIVAIASG